MSENKRLLWAIKGKCVSCGRGRLFKSYLNLVDECSDCHHDYRSDDSADGPAYIVLCIVGLVVSIMAVWYELSYSPNMWEHVILWPIIIIASSILLLRPVRAILVALAYIYSPRNG